MNKEEMCFSGVVSVEDIKGEENFPAHIPMKDRLWDQTFNVLASNIHGDERARTWVEGMKKVYKLDYKSSKKKGGFLQRDHYDIDIKMTGTLKEIEAFKQTLCVTFEFSYDQPSS